MFNVAGWCVAIVLALSTLYGEYSAMRKNNPKPFTRAENIIYGTFSRGAWGLALAWVIFACHRGLGGKGCSDSSPVVSLYLSLVARGVWWEGSKRGRASFYPSPSAPAARVTRRRLGTSQGTDSVNSVIHYLVIQSF